ncbi:SGNH/GDSL hydrolase family protein [Acetobacter tropicalis]|uniref:Putative secreted protein n=1 Tax=Acetobacter tropicalis TaxID=104102 RepID=A0A094YNJ0_9PROT|nr:SGNH/GDSL hydrolase family protein [Acetobacter tropicalis]KAA8390582.1 SGNH/GDSL hydrolase family protein [Acetobacter tropicalis]KAA8393354.1 SGNH/GDSL hydrolase family protein [Acetobacter tropicalis]KGB22937.1 putative secreted protein [Acetobacter tropicalis]MBC9007133.1 SGNH/GDSL hydrolase family protein [Acetobacter tropicalis]MDO8171319.1 SGNH/GDSL hydrolase family protein [Acetobacter tropicalis]
MVAAVPERNRKRSVADILPVLLGAAFAAVATACPVHAAPQEAQNAPSITVGVWGAAPAFPTGPAVVASTIRQTVRLSLGGEGVSIRLSNEMGQAPLVIKAAHVALPGTQKGSIDPASDHALTFGGRKGIVIPPGGVAISDVASVTTSAGQDVVISFYVSRSTGPVATHPLGLATTYVSRGPDASTASTLPNATTTQARLFLSGVSVVRRGGQAVVALGDSITDGLRSPVDANQRWPDDLSQRLIRAGMAVSVVNAGISGNRVQHDLPLAESGPSAVSRFDRDVLSVPGVRTVIIMESINDIGHPGAQGLAEQAVSTEDLIAGLQQLVLRAHQHGLRVIGATLTPFAGTIFPGYYSQAGEAKRQAVNQWIRTGRAFDGVVDMDAALRDPAHPDHMLPAYDSGDHLHPNAEGYRHMADAVPLSLLQAP